MNTATFFMFVGDQCGKLEEALMFYTALFPDSEIGSIERYEEGDVGGTPELIKYATFTIKGTTYMASENNLGHDFDFTPAISLFVNCDTEEQMAAYFDQLSKGGQIMMSLDDYGFTVGQKFGWCSDKYGISWQLNLPNA